MKFKALTLAVAAAAMPYGVSAAGLNPTGSFDAILYLSGASAEDNLLFDSFLKDVCADNISVLNKPSTSSTPHKLGNYFGVACTVKASGSLIDTNIQGKNVLFVKRSAGGSAYGVNTLLETPPRKITQIDRTTCVKNGTYTSPITSVGTVDNYDCQNTTGTNDIAPDAGISDLNPEMFAGTLNTPVGFKSVDPVDAQTKFGKGVKGVVGQAFGIVVTTNLRDALQVAQFGAGNACTVAGSVAKESEACMPTLSTQVVNSLLTGRITTWGSLVKDVNGKGTALTSLPGIVKPNSVAVKICRRVPGSGTQATINATLLNSPCTTTNPTPLVGNNVSVAQGSGSGDVDKCLQAWNTGVAQSIATDKGTGSYTVNSAGTASVPVRAWAIGFQGLEKASTHFKFVKLNGYAPTLKNVHAGLYPIWGEATIQYRVDGLNALSVQPNGALKLAVVNTIRNVVGSASNLASLNSLLPNPAYLALSTQTGQVPDSVFKASNPVVAFTHTTTNTDACRTPVINPTYKNKTPLAF